MMAAMGMMAAGMNGGQSQQPPPAIADGPGHVNVALNATAACLCCPARPVHREVVSLRPQNWMGFVAQFEGFCIEQALNEWEGGLPPALQGRVDPAAWSSFIADISLLGENAPGCCSCFGTAQSDFTAALNTAANKASASLGCPVTVRTFQYETWSPPDPQQNQPGRWNQQTMRYFHIEFAPPQMPMMQPQMMQMPMMQPPMVQQPMAMSSQQPQMNPTYGQPVMMAQQPVGVPVIDPNAMGALMAAQLANANAMAAALGQPQHVVVTGPDGKPHVQVVAPGQAPGQQPQYYVAQPPQHPQ